MYITSHISYITPKVRKGEAVVEDRRCSPTRRGSPTASSGSLCSGSPPPSSSSRRLEFLVGKLVLPPAGVPTLSSLPVSQGHQALVCGQKGRFSGKRVHSCTPLSHSARVLMLGAAGVGKTSLCSQFLSSANNNSYEPDSEAIEKEVSVSINNQETRLVFVDHTHGEISVSHGYIEMNGMSDLKVVQVPCCGLNSFQLFQWH